MAFLTYLFILFVQEQLPRVGGTVLPIQSAEQLPPAVRETRGRSLRFPAILLAAAAASAVPVHSAELQLAVHLVCEFPGANLQPTTPAAPTAATAAVVRPSVD